MRPLITAIVLVAGLWTGVGTATADTPAGRADLGSADFTKAGTVVTVPALAPCSVDGAASANSASVKKTGISFGSGTSSCVVTVVDPETQVTTSKSQATGKDFELSALVSVGGPRIRLRSYEVTCTATQDGTNASWKFGGMTGIGALPSPVPENYPKAITKNGAVLANAVFNIVDKPGDGSVALTMLRIDFAPASGITGSVTLGSTACSPTP